MAVEVVGLARKRQRRVVGIKIGTPSIRTKGKVLGKGQKVSGVMTVR